MRTPSRLRRATLAAMPCVIAMALASCASAPQIALVGRLTVTPNALTFQDTAVGETSPEGALLVTNAGNIAVKFDRAAIGSADFVTSSGDCPVSTLAPGATCSLRLVFTPKTTGLRTTTATILSDATTAAPSVTLTGNGIVPTKVLTPTPAALNFSDTVVGTGARQDLLVLNTGTATVKVSAVGLSGPNASDFLTDTSFCGEPATPSGTGCTLSVSFTPSAPGPRSATLTITSDATGSPLNVKLTGKGVAPTKILSVTPKAINFPDTAVGEVGVTSG